MSRKTFVCRAPIVLALGLFTPLAEAQPAAEEHVMLQLGARVRVTLAGESRAAGSGMRLVGRLTGTDPESLMLALSASESRDLRRDAIVRLEQSVRPSRKNVGAIIGFGLGFGAAFLYVERAWQWNCLAGGGCNASVLFASIAVSTLAACPIAALGSIVAPGEQWADVPLGRGHSRATRSVNPGLQLRLVPVVGRRTGLAVVASF